MVRHLIVDQRSLAASLRAGSVEAGDANDALTANVLEAYLG